MHNFLDFYSLDFFAVRLVTAGLLAAVAFVALPLILLTALARLGALALLTALVWVLARLALVLVGILVHVRHLKNS
jgi:hypothetical protein